jgi:hypothetical protein
MGSRRTDRRFVFKAREGQEALTPAQRAKRIAKRKAAYEAVHPETKKGSDRRSKSQLGTLNKEAFVDDTAAKSGRLGRPLTATRPAQRCQAPIWTALLNAELGLLSA